jgi:RHS repeat-associated protein
VRLSSTLINHTIVADQAFSPYGEVYAQFGSTAQNEAVFAGLTQDVLSGMWDTPNRELAPQGRWLSPDPAGYGWNQYAYLTNPLSTSDQTGLGPGGCPFSPVVCSGGLNNGSGAGAGDDGWGEFMQQVLTEVPGAGYVPSYAGVPGGTGTVGADTGSSGTDSGGDSGITATAAELTQLAGPEAGPDAGFDFDEMAAQPAGIQIGYLMFQFDMSNCCGNDGNAVFPDFPDNATMIGNAWYMQVANGFGWPLSGNFSVTENVFQIANESDPNFPLATSQYTWTTNSTGGFVDNILVGFNSIGPTYFQNHSRPN